jgi:protein-S-isoprenylcysteine O-methyltransferase Ste14
MDIVKWLRNQWDRAAAVAAVVFGVVALMLGYLGVSRSTLATQQIPYLASGGLAGLFALGLGATLWLSADLRDEWRKLDLIHKDVSLRQVSTTTGSGPTAPSKPRAHRTRTTADG